VKWTMRFEKWLSKLADRVITNSQAALEEYRQHGYSYSKLSHVANAIDTNRFKPDPEARNSVATEFEIAPGAPLIGLFARIHPMKDHLTFLRAAKLLLAQLPNARFICAGEVSSGFTHHNERIRANATELGLDNSVLWVGPRTDPERLMAACDITTLSSDSGEGFPNSVAESLACGTPCPTVDVGDAARIVADFSEVVPRSNPEKLANAWFKQISELKQPDNEISQQLRNSIIDRFSQSNIAVQTLELLTR
jgi:glycosyltransferase involved in cell wall biosynthesis